MNNDNLQSITSNKGKNFAFDSSGTESFISTDQPLDDEIKRINEMPIEQVIIELDKMGLLNTPVPKLSDLSKKHRTLSIYKFLDLGREFLANLKTPSFSRINMASGLFAVVIISLFGLNSFFDSSNSPKDTRTQVDFNSSKVEKTNTEIGAVPFSAIASKEDKELKTIGNTDNMPDKKLENSKENEFGYKKVRGSSNGRKNPNARGNNIKQKPNTKDKWEQIQTKEKINENQPSNINAGLIDSEFPDKLLETFITKKTFNIEAIKGIFTVEVNSMSGEGDPSKEEKIQMPIKTERSVKDLTIRRSAFTSK